MVARSSLITLASGRLTPLSRLALVLGLGLFAALVLLVQPVHRATPALVAVRASVRAVEPGSAWAERAELEEGSSMFMPTPREVVPLTDAAQPDAAPFSAFGPEYRHDPSKPLAISSSALPIRWKSLEQAFPISEDRPFATLGQKSPRPAPEARPLQVQVFSDLNENVIARDFSTFFREDKGLKSLFSNSLGIKSPVEMRLGIDAMGLQSKPYLIRSSGDNEWDQAVCGWARTLPWTSWLKPGSYRVVVGP